MQEINKQELALWWINNAIKFLFVILLMAVIYFSYTLYWKPLGVLIHKDKYNLNPRPVCAPASLNGKTVTNCIQK